MYVYMYVRMHACSVSSLSMINSYPFYNVTDHWNSFLLLPALDEKAELRF